MGVRYSDLVQTYAPDKTDWVALLHPAPPSEGGVLLSCTLADAVNCTLGTADISAVGDGTVKGAISYLYAATGGDIIIQMSSQSAYDNLPDVEKNDGKIRFVS